MAPFEHVVVDEAQDINAPQLRFGEQQRNALFFADDRGSASSSSRSPGNRSALMSGVGPARYTATTVLRTRLGCRPSGCSGLNWLAGARCQSSTGRCLWCERPAFADAEVQAMAEWIAECTGKGFGQVRSRSSCTLTLNSNGGCVPV